MHAILGGRAEGKSLLGYSAGTRLLYRPRPLATPVWAAASDVIGPIADV
jgi:hypothetical protein